MITNPVPTIHYNGILQVHPSVHCTPGDNTVRLGPNDHMTVEQLDQFILTLQHARHWASTGTAPAPSTPVATSIDDPDHLNHLLEPASIPTAQPWLVRDDQGLCLALRCDPEYCDRPWCLIRVRNGDMRYRSDADVTLVRPIDIAGLNPEETS